MITTRANELYRTYWADWCDGLSAEQIAKKHSIPFVIANRAIMTGKANYWDKPIMSDFNILNDIITRIQSKGSEASNLDMAVLKLANKELMQLEIEREE